GDHVSSALHERAELRDTTGRHEVERDARVQAALPEVPVERRGAVAVLVELTTEVTQVVAQAGRIDGGVLPAGPGVRLSLYASRGAEPCLPDLPQQTLVLDIIKYVHAGILGMPAEIGDYSAGRFIRLLLGVAARPDEQVCLACGQGVQRRNVDLLC